MTVAALIFAGLLVLWTSLTYVRLPGGTMSKRILLVQAHPDASQLLSAVFPLPNSAGSATSASPATAASASAIDSRGGAGVPPRHAVFLVDEGRARQTAVVLGARNGNAAWIHSGIATGQQVIAYPPATVRDGLRVVARKP